MREIKFRGKDIDGNWVYGCLVRYSDSISYITSDIIEKPMELVSTETVGQFTGSIDMNKNDIYEGDIVTGGKIITWKGGAWGYDNCMWNNKIQVIGNIYDNPDLIK